PDAPPPPHIERARALSRRTARQLAPAYTRLEPLDTAYATGADQQLREQPARQIDLVGLPDCGDAGLEGALQHIPHDASRVEMLLDQRPGEGRVPLVVRLGARERGGGFFEGAEPKQALRLGQETARASVLYHGGLPGRQVAQRAVAHPRRLPRQV